MTRQHGFNVYSVLVSKTEKILFFDGDCSLCRRSVRFLMKQDRKKQVYFAPLQGKTARELLPRQLWAELDTLVYLFSDGQYLTRSSALIHYLRESGGLLSVPARLLSILPSSLLDLFYDNIAKRRHRLVPAKTCSLEENSKDQRILP